jgi:bifunctional DNA-binding transcriptional regulator/antitoxin component of YhaV-PrlF toxin-antitoxin module
MPADPEVTTMSEKGQVVIPQALRKQMGFMPKTKFAVYGQGDLIILKRLELPDLRAEWDRIFTVADQKKRVSARDVAKEVKSVRKRHR